MWLAGRGSGTAQRLRGCTPGLSFTGGSKHHCVREGVPLAFAEMGLPRLPSLPSGPGCSEAEGERWCPGLIWGLEERGTRGRNPRLPLRALWLQNPKETEDGRGCWVQAGGAGRSRSVSCRPGLGVGTCRHCSVSLSFSGASKDITRSSSWSLQRVHASPPSRVAGRASAWTALPSLEKAFPGQMMRFHQH